MVKEESGDQDLTRTREGDSEPENKQVKTAKKRSKRLRNKGKNAQK